MFLQIQTAAERLVETHLFSLPVPAVPGADPGPLGHVGPEPEQKLLVGAGEPRSDPERQLAARVTGPRPPQAEHNAGDRRSQVRGRAAKGSLNN